MSVGRPISQAIRCTFPKCGCECFSSTKNQIRTCQSCNHGWVAHAIDKLISSTNPFSGVGVQVEPITPSIVFDIASLVLYGCQAIPIRLKMSLDRLFSALQHDEVLQILHGFGWSYEDYARGYILQDPNGRVLEKYAIISREEEITVLQQFNRFGETRNISQELLLQDTKPVPQEPNSQINQSKSESDIRKFIERSNMTLIQSYNLALRRAFDSPQSIFSAMGAGFPPHLNIAAAAAASQFGRGLTGTGGLMPMPNLGFPQAGESKSETPNQNETVNRRTSTEPYDLTKRSPTESHSKTSSPASSTSAAGPTTNMLSAFPKMEGAFPKMESREKEEISVNDALMSDAMKQRTTPPVNPLRRPTTPPSSKQGWPFNNPAFGQTVFVTSSGKKRVLCTACNKTFCDKGALKIHYSAVHLKEMHRCTIPGCNMMFSSRRSRNRHSANPNPKLHTPQTRRPRERYESEHDRMSAMMGLPTGAKMENDCNSSIDDNEVGEMMQDKISMDEYNRDSNTASDDEQCDVEYSIGDRDEDLPTQIKHDSPLYRSNKRKRLMPTRVQMSTTPTVLDDEAKSETERNASAASNGSADSVLNVSGDLMAMRRQDSCELGELRMRSPVEPGEVIRQDGGLEKASKHVPKFPPMAGTNKQASMMQSIFSSFLPPNADNQGNASWLNLFQQTAAMAAAQTAAQKANQRATMEQNSEDESNGSDIEERRYNCNTVENCNPVFGANENRDSHITNKIHRKMFENNATADTDSGDNLKQCLFCDKSFSGEEMLNKHLQSVHQSQQHMFNDPNFSTQIDSIKSKTPVVA